MGISNCGWKIFIYVLMRVFNRKKGKCGHHPVGEKGKGTVTNM